MKRVLGWLLRSTASMLAGLVVVMGLFVGVARAGAIGGNGGGGGGLAQAAADLLYCALAGCTMTGATTYSGLSTDVTTGTNEDWRVRGNGSGTVRLQTGTGQQMFIERADGTSMIQFDVSSAVSMRSNGNDGTILLGNAALGHALIGATLTDAASTVIVGGVADAMGTSAGGSKTLLFSVRGEGTVTIEKQQALTCVANAGAGGTLGGVTFTQASSAVYITNPDTDGCIVTVGETNASVGSDVEFVVVSNAGGVITFPAAANVHAGPTLAVTTGLGLNDSYRIHYTDKADDMWVGVVATDN